MAIAETSRSRSPSVVFGDRDAPVSVIAISEISQCKKVPAGRKRAAGACGRALANPGDLVPNPEALCSGRVASSNAPKTAVGRSCGDGCALDDAPRENWSGHWSTRPVACITSQLAR
jgi:hypothetical protein